ARKFLSVGFAGRQRYDAGVGRHDPQHAGLGRSDEPDRPLRFGCGWQQRAAACASTGTGGASTGSASMKIALKIFAMTCAAAGVAIADPAPNPAPAPDPALPAKAIAQASQKPTLLLRGLDK